MASKLLGISLLKTQISLMGSVEKDIQLSNSSNFILISATLLGRKVTANTNDLLESRDILSLFEKQNQSFINDAIKTWGKIQTHSRVERARRLSNTAITVCCTQLKWVLSTSRYNIDCTLQGDCVGS